MSFYRPFLSRQYRGAVAVGLPVTLIAIMLSLLGAIPLYLVLKALAVEYAAAMTPPLAFDPATIGARFAKATGLSVPAAGLFVLGLLAAIAVASSLVSGRILRAHEESWGAKSRRCRAEIAARVVPGMELRGRVVARIEGARKEYEEEDPLRRDQPTRRSASFFPTVEYAVELQGVLGMPVYLSVELEGDPGSNALMVRWDSLAASGAGSALFVVNEDLSVRLAG